MNNTQSEQILNHLKQDKDKSITPMDAVQYYDIYRLSAVILRLRNAGHDIVTHHERNHSGIGRHARYELKEWQA